MFEKIKEILVDEFDLDEEDIREEASFKNDLGLDSLDLFQLVRALEDEFGFSVPAEELLKMETIGDVLEFASKNGIGD